MTVAQLIQKLQNLNPELEVGFAYGYGDYIRTTVVADVSEAEEGEVVYSEYHQMDKLIEVDEYADEDHLDPEDRTEAEVTTTKIIIR
jgi:hypothetical protein